MSRWLLLFVLSLGSPALARAQGLSVQGVIGEARAHNPTLKAALLQLESAQWDLMGSEAQYEPVLTVTGSGSQLATSNVFSGAVRINTVRRGDLSATLSKHLIWGTDLSLQLSTYVQKNEFSGGLGLLPGSGSGMAPMIPGLLSAFGSFGPVYSGVAKLTLKQALWRGRGRDVGEATIRASRATLTQTERTRDRVASELVRDVLTAYWELWYADAALGIQRQAREVALRQREEAQARVRSGSLAPAEVLTFETQVAQRDEDILGALTERQARVHELSRLIGAEHSALAFETLSDEPQPAGGFSRALVEQSALADSLEVQERAAAVELARIQQKTADDPNKPQLDLDGYVQTQGVGNRSVENAAEQFVSGDVISAYLGITYSAPVRDRVRRATAAKARLASEIAEQNLRETRQRVLSEVRGALDREAAGAQKVELAERTTSIAERQLSAEQARYASGSTTPIAVAEAEDAVRTARLRLSRARADWAEAAITLEHLSGGLLRRYAVR